jgi:fluoride exporter
MDRLGFVGRVGFGCDVARNLVQSPVHPRNPKYKVEQGGWILEKYLMIAIGGALGSIARYWVGSAISDRLGTRFPYGTFVINVTSCIIIGFTLTYLGKRADLNPMWRFLVPVGFIGAYSTFSTYEWETLSTVRSGAFLLAALYAVGSLFLGLVAAWGGSLLGEVLG